MYGEYRNLIMNTAKSHTRALYLDKDYRDATIYFTKQRLAKIKGMSLIHTNDKLGGITETPASKECPLCYMGDEGNTRHLHTVCQNRNLILLRNTLLQQVEIQLKNFFDLTNVIGQQADVIMPLNLYDTLVRNLQQCERRLPQTQVEEDVKYRTGNVQIRNMSEWMLSMHMDKSKVDEGQINNLRNNKYCLTLGVMGKCITCYDANTSMTSSVTKKSKGEIKTKTIPVTSPVDKIYLALLPNIFNDTIQDFIRKTSGRGNAELLKEMKQKWKTIQQSLKAKAIMMQRGVNGQLTMHMKTIKSNYKEAKKNSTTNPISIDNENSTETTNIRTNDHRQHAIQGYKCKGPLCQQRLLHHKHLLPNIVKTSSAWCSSCNDEEKGWIVARKVEEMIVQAPRRQLTSLTKFLDTNYYKKNVALPAI